MPFPVQKPCIYFYNQENKYFNVPVVFHHLWNEVQNTCDMPISPFKSSPHLSLTSETSILLPRSLLCHNAFHLHLYSNSLITFKVHPKYHSPIFISSIRRLFCSIFPPKHILFINFCKEMYHILPWNDLSVPLAYPYAPCPQASEPKTSLFLFLTLALGIKNITCVHRI